MKMRIECTNDSKNVQTSYFSYERTWRNLDKPVKTWRNLDKPEETWRNMEKPGKTRCNLEELGET